MTWVVSLFDGNGDAMVAALTQPWNVGQHQPAGQQVPVGQQQHVSQEQHVDQQQHVGQQVAVPGDAHGAAGGVEPLRGGLYISVSV